MDRLIYTALSGLQRTTEAQAVTAHNLANAQVPGFRREMAALSAGYLEADGAALSARAQSGGESPHDLMSAGQVATTDQPLDIAMNGNAWLAVADTNGGEGLTRRGDLFIDPEGMLRNGDGRPVLGDSGPIWLGGGFSSVIIGRDGSIEARATPETPYTQVGQLRLVTPDTQELERGPDGLFRTPEILPSDPTATVTVGALEGSNVDHASMLVDLVQQARAFEMQTKLLSAAREMDEGSARLMRME